MEGKKRRTARDIQRGEETIGKVVRGKQGHEVCTMNEMERGLGILDGEGRVITVIRVENEQGYAQTTMRNEEKSVLT